MPAAVILLNKRWRYAGWCFFIVVLIAIVGGNALEKATTGSSAIF